MTTKNDKKKTYKKRLRYAGVSDLFSLEVVVTLRRCSGFVDCVRHSWRKRVLWMKEGWLYTRSLWPGLMEAVEG